MINQVIYLGDRPIHIVVKRNLFQLIPVLIRFNCDLESLNYDNITPLQIAIQNGNILMIKILICYGASPYNIGVIQNKQIKLIFTQAKKIWEEVELEKRCQALRSFFELDGFLIDFFQDNLN